jgi:hypothetical protein
VAEGEDALRRGGGAELPQQAATQGDPALGRGFEPLALADDQDLQLDARQQRLADDPRSLEQDLVPRPAGRQAADPLDELVVG